MICLSKAHQSGEERVSKNAFLEYQRTAIVLFLKCFFNLYQCAG